MASHVLEAAQHHPRGQYSEKPFRGELVLRCALLLRTHMRLHMIIVAITNLLWL